MAQLKKIEEEAKALKDAAARYDIAERKRARTARRLQERDRLRARLPEIERARLEWQAVHAQLAACGPVDAQPTGDELAERQAIESAIAGIEAARLAENPKRAGETASLNRLLAQLPAPFDAALLTQAVKDVEAATRALDAADQQLTQRQQAQQTVADSASRLARVESQVVEARGKVAHIEAQIALWSMLAKALGNDGIVALSIDDAGPTLSALANDLLLGCYGPRFTVSLKTQVENAKGECREGFSIVVHDAQSGQSKELDNMSGGEKLWINECLTRAIALYLAQNSGQRYETLFSDEADGPLDADRKRMFMAMKREVLRLGGYGREFFISQTPELTEMADAVIDLDAMRATTVPWPLLDSDPFGLEVGAGSVRQ